MRRIRSKHPSTLLLATTIAVASLPPSVAAVEFECSVPGDTRYLRLELPGKDHLCEVTVTMASENERRVKWYADNDSLFCSTKIEELRDKYIDLWDYQCAEWPDRIGVDNLSARHRTIVDQLLKTHLEDAATEAGSPRIDSVRVTGTPQGDGAPGMLALQLFFDNGDEALRIITDDGAAWRVLTDLDGLAGAIDEVEGYDLVGAYIESFGDTATIDVMTLLSPTDSLADNGDTDTSAVCEGRQSFRTDSSGTLDAASPHRHLCN